VEPNFKRNMQCGPRLSGEELSKVIGVDSPSARLSLLLSPSLLAHLHPHAPGHFEFWLSDGIMRASKLSVGQEIRIKTAGDSLLAAEAKPTSASHFDQMEGGKVLSQVSKLTDRFADDPSHLPPGSDGGR